MLAGASALTALAILARFLERYLSGLQVCIGVVLAALMMQGHVFARPHVLAWPLMVFWVAGVTRALEAGRAPSPWLAVVIFVWANMHGSFVLALGVMGLLALEGMARAWTGSERREVVRGWIVFGVLSGVAALATPHSIWNVLHIVHLQTQKVQLSFIAEWQPPNFGSFEAAQIWMLLLLAVSWSLGARFPLARIAVVLVLLHMTLKHARHAEWLGLIAPMLLASGLAAVLPRRAVEGDPLYRLGRTALAAAALVPALVGICYAVAVALSPAKPDPRVTPDEALAAARASGVTGNVLNDYDFGGYLIFSGVPTFVDGRSDLFGDAFLQPYVAFVEKPDERRFRALADQHRVDWTLLRTGSEAAKLLDRLPDWHRVHQDGTAAVHRRTAPRGYPSAQPRGASPPGR